MIAKEALKSLSCWSLWEADKIKKMSPFLYTMTRSNIYNNLSIHDQKAYL